ncbi:Farnesyl pyrophosphate synthetase [Cytospora paraplurivora]|uniref:Farnesyl pyrophosphate synthetase n=1 Tax=Cytospora paraplurivora TaxID=2898453 RepID=A0AAN9UJY2_9PEZI
MAGSLDTFNTIFPILADDLRSLCCEQYRLREQVWKWLEKSLIHNALGGKCNRGLSVIDTAQLILNRDLTADEYFQTATLGWMVEFLQAMMLVVDDIMDHSETRRGRPCWYLMPGISMQAANDAPVALALLYTGRTSPRNLKQAEEVLLEMGTYFQVQDDYLDNFADLRSLAR